jgi:pectin methylesterase-like acyl-CoA thioesterase
MKIVYKPFGLILGLLAGFMSQKLFNVVWGLFDREEPPKPTTQEAEWTKVIAAAAVQGVTFRVTRAAVDRAGAKGFHHMTGVWPGERQQEQSQAAEAAR